MTDDQIIYVILGTIILFLSYELHASYKDVEFYRKECDRREFRLKASSLPPPAPPAPTIEEWKFIVIENAGDNGVLNRQVAIYINDGYIFDHEASNDKYLAFYKINPIEKADEA